MNVRRHTRIAESADQDGIEIALQHGEAVGRDGHTIGKIAVGAPVEVDQLDRRSGGGKDFCSFRDYFTADTISRNYSDSFLGGHARKITQMCATTEISERLLRQPFGTANGLLTACGVTRNV